ncbi:MurR/RpiR family transcriptional regulator [Aliiroseovarius sp. YM-037]|uniref:MurR/RpiR family transcriptional regulator n=1 Tax=Aliiroseovarius sp. YM-037 TaxID=3341728 RepID=UPI003A80BDEB
MPTPTQTVRDLIRDHYDTLTQTERKLANALLENYPAAGLASITIVAENSGVSTPTVARMVQKLGFKGFPQFHQTLREELEAKISGPVQKREVWAAEAPESHMLNRFADAVMQNIRQSLSHVDTDKFDRAVERLADKDTHLFVVGGRVTRALAEYASTHLQAVRPHVTHMTSSAATWPHYVLDMTEGDVLLMFDIRRYENNLQRLAELAVERGVQVILITDPWTSPVAKIADPVFNCWGEIPSAWDSNISTLMLLEALIAAVQEKSWPDTKERFEKLDEIFDVTRLYRKFS